MSIIAIKDLNDDATLDQAAMSEFHGGIARHYPTAQIDGYPTAQIRDFEVDTGPDPLYFSKPIPHKN